ncbi:MAG TPA: cupin domain-containing protein [Candidatus Baltobacteraceae bacterium]|jgi:mannose-6-phosphate isomerase-like protein (cupin superfamily)|nr:cupin domain-containing protein [Candidatus Baltobacteraceae bacterium]
MKRLIALAAALATVALAYTMGRAQETATPYADTNAIFGQLDADRNGTVPQQIMHAPAGDVLAVYIGKAPRQMYTKQDELIYVISGQGTANVGYPSYTLKPGSLLSIPRKTAFEITSTGSIPIKALVIASPNNDPNDKQVLQQ